MPTENDFNGNSEKTALFKGKIKSMRLTTEPCYFPRIAEPGDDLEQKLTITAKGRVNVCRKISRVYDSNQETETITEKAMISPDDTEKIFNSISRHFAIIPEMVEVLDGGVWELKLTNTEGAVFHFCGSTSHNHESALGRLSKMLREITGVEYLLGFDESIE